MIKFPFESLISLTVMEIQKIYNILTNPSLNNKLILGPTQLHVFLSKTIENWFDYKSKAERKQIISLFKLFYRVSNQQI